jgi:hypothetical protein
MLRTGLCVALSVWSAMPASAEAPNPVFSPAVAEMSVQHLRHPIDLSQLFRDATRPRIEEDSAVLAPHYLEGRNSAESQGLSLGPLHIGGSNGMGGRHRHLAHFRVDGLTVFGGSVGGSVDGRSANIVLSWPAEP